MRKKNLFLSFLFLCSSLIVFSQDFSSLQNVTLEDYEQYKSAEQEVIECCDYLLSNPYDKKDVNRLYAAQFLLKWMEGTPEYTFEINDEAMTLTNGKTELLQIYLAALTKTRLTIKDGSVSKEELNEKSKSLFIEYCSDSNNGIKLTKELKKVLKSEQAIDS